MIPLDDFVCFKRWQGLRVKCEIALDFVPHNFG